jgi:hypothetical protein
MEKYLSAVTKKKKKNYLFNIIFKYWIVTMGNSGAKIEKRLADKPVVVIIGGGYAGAALAKALDDQVNVLLFERKVDQIKLNNCFGKNESDFFRIFFS